MTAKSFTRFTVDGPSYADTARDAIKVAKTRLYISAADEDRAILKLTAGDPVTFTYGFVSCTIWPPGQVPGLVIS